MKRIIIAVLLCACSLARPLFAEENKATHDELRALRDSLLDALNKQDVEKLLSHLHKNVIVTWQDGSVCRGHNGFRTYYNRMMTGPDRVVQKFDTQVSVDELTILYGDNTGIAFGSANDHFTLKGGLDVTLKDRWTATLVKENGHWLIAAAHMSASVFDNPLLAGAKKVTLIVAVCAGGVGLLLGWVVCRRRKNKTA